MKRSALPARTKGILPVSKRRRRLMTARRRAVAERVDRCHGSCEAFSAGSVSCNGDLQPHEPLTRARGGSITDVENIRMVCATHHQWIHDNPLSATIAGLLVPSWAD